MGRFSISRKQPIGGAPARLFVLANGEYIGFENTRWRPRAVLALWVIQNVKGIPSATAAGAGGWSGTSRASTSSTAAALVVVIPARP